MRKPLHTGDVARLLNVSQDRVRQLAEAGALHATRAANGMRLFDLLGVQSLEIARAVKREAKRRQRLKAGPDQ
jgi:DNA-binding transcriptional MerR regulator